jgi:hypothetical protein
MPLTLWHRTRTENAALIRREGFRDGAGRYLTELKLSGVWLSDHPLDANDGAWGEVLLRVALDCTEADIRDFEWIEEGGLIALNSCGGER